MKMLNQLLMLLLLSAVIAACGKKNDSGGGSPAPAVTTPAAGSSGGRNFTDYNQLVNHYKAKSMTHGLGAGDVVYHIGPFFGGPSNAVDFDDLFDVDFDFDYCINIFGHTSGDCHQSSQNLNYYEDLINSGDYKIVNSGDHHRTTYRVAQDVTNNGVNYGTYVVDREDGVYKSMLNFTDLITNKVVITPATVQVVDMKTNQSRTIKADYVEYFYQTSHSAQPFYMGYVISNEIALAANPIAVVEDYQQVGMLVEGGKYRIISVVVQQHELDLGLRAIPVGKFNLTL